MKKTLLGIALIVAPLPLLAQSGEQTVENAQKFLSLTLPGNGYVPGTLVRLIEPSSNRYASKFRYQGKGRITEVLSPAHCRTAIWYDISGISVEVNDGMDANFREVVGHWKRDATWFSRVLSPREFTGGQVAGDPAGFSWSDVKEVKVPDGSTAVYLLFNDGIHQYTKVELGAKDMATRVGYAMEFLRMSCDKAAGTGF